MPIYEYFCENCSYNLEKLQKISDVLLKQCPLCHVDALKKQVSAARFRLKGRGWYETDFKGSHDKRKNLVDAPNKTKTNDSLKDK